MLLPKISTIPTTRFGNFGKIKRKNAGFTLIELMLVMAAIVILTTLTFAGQVRDRDIAIAKATGDQLKNIGAAFNEYIVTYHDPLVNLVSAPNPTDDGGPRTCDTSNNTCTININTLINAGVLPPGFRGLTPYQSAYVLQIKRRPIGTTGNYSLDGLVVTALPWTTGGTTPRYDLLGAAIQEAGADAGMSRASATQIDGYNGMWSETSTDFSAIDAQGLLGYRTGFSSNAYGAFVRTDGSTPMEGPLNMNGNTIFNVQDIQATGGIEANSLYVDGGVLQLGSTTAGPGPTQIFANSAAGVQQTVFQQKDGILIVQPNGTPADIAAVNNIRAVGNITTQGQIITNQTLQIKNSGKTSGLSLYNSGDLGNTGMIYTNTIQVAADPSTGITPSTDATTRFMLFGSGFSSHDWSVYRTLYSNSFDAVSGNTVTFGDTTPTSVLFNNDIYLQGGLFLNKVVTTVPTATCTSNEVGSYARTPSGGLVVCDSGLVWKSAAILTTVVEYGNQTTSVNVPTTAYCPAGSFATGGGFRRTAIFNPAANPLPTSPIDSTPIPAGTGSSTGGYQVTAGTTAVGFTPFVNCAVVND